MENPYLLLADESYKLFLYKKLPGKARHREQ